jgi:hypothetical protein
MDALVSFCIVSDFAMLWACKTAVEVIVETQKRNWTEWGVVKGHFVQCVATSDDRSSLALSAIVVLEAKLLIVEDSRTVLGSVLVQHTIEKKSIYNKVKLILSDQSCIFWREYRYNFPNSILAPLPSLRASGLVATKFNH